MIAFTQYEMLREKANICPQSFLPMPNVDRCVVGYDPGGDGSHGVAVLRLRDGIPVQLQTETLQTTEETIKFFLQLRGLSAIGVDTLTCWSTGPGGWRPADRFLRFEYPQVARSVVTPNGLYGSMGLNGPAVVLQCRAALPALLVTEAHPKVLHWHLSGRRYNFKDDRALMEELLCDALGVPVVTATEHAWDAAVSALAALKGLLGEWSLDLHQRQCEPNERLVWPCGPAHYFWPSGDR
jgi:hypothetical protein